ncbi:MAG: SMI1/KNR4 family protein [Bacteroidia bacterium]
MQIIQYAEKILQTQEEIKHPGAQMLNQGLKEGHIREVAAMYDVHFSEEVVALYQWRNGLNSRYPSGSMLKMGDVCFFPGYVFLSIEDAINAYNRSKLQQDWNKDWFPLFWNSAGCMFVMDCGEENRGQMIEFGGPYFDSEVVYASLSDMLKTIAKSYEVGGFYFDEEFGLACDDQIFCALAKDLNPDVLYWQRQ